MFFFENLLFLISNAFISWAVLCYWHKVNEIWEQPHQLDSALDPCIAVNPVEETLAARKRSYPMCHTCIYSLCVLAYICLLVEYAVLFLPNIRATIAMLKRFKERVRGGWTDHGQYGRNAGYRATFTAEDCRRMIITIRKDILQIWKDYDHLAERFYTMEQNISLLKQNGVVVKTTDGGGDDDTLPRSPSVYGLKGQNCGTDISVGNVNIVCPQCAVSGDKNNGDKFLTTPSGPVVRVLQERGQNVFIANQFPHMNRQVGFQTDNGGEFIQVWQKYLEMQRLCRGTSSGRSVPPTGEKSNIGVEIRESKIDLSRTDVPTPPSVGRASNPRKPLMGNFPKPGHLLLLQM